MAIKIHWHQDATNDFFAIVDYFEQEEEIQAAINFRENVLTKLNFICQFPGAGRPTKKRRNLRYILVDKYRRMYYRYTTKSIILLAFFDARQNPEKAPF